ncbi:cupin domain-containing protein [Thalassolituus oleivorans]|jgi:50S ribosomal protein L16 3-hydroxylase|uniref:cupin domain-containing protein n=1 Tax=Thalassolituus oleivorans TaxID=187493 RepID=UPI00042DBF89|nr:cupin domain-containing protein [Thalassolituus oleivorans]AHK15753.1 cupin [Thalassolituus oleivorans R6-15]
MHLLGNLSIDEFLRDYWQQKPVLIRNAWPNFEPLLSAQELAGLSLEDDIESRLILEQGQDGPWEIRKGPFSETDYRSLPKSHWTLLIQAIDHWVPEAAELLEHFRFIPSWRIDDLMISYAVDGGSVGPHYDQYDVFLLQAEGQREWRIGQHCDSNSPIIGNTRLRILSEFEETERWVLNPGDMLYLPPQLAHYGIAQGECMTYSIGFRAPSVSQLLETSLDVVLPTLTENQRYCDAGIQPAVSASRIDQQATERLANLLTSELQKPEVLAKILGQLMTEPKYSELLPEAENEITWDEWLDTVEGESLLRHEHARFAYFTDDNQCLFFNHGECTVLPKPCTQLVATLGDYRQYSIDQLQHLALDDQGKNLLLQLWAQQMIYVESDTQGVFDGDCND